MAKNRKFIHRIIMSRFWLSIFLCIVLLLVLYSTSLFVKREKVWKKVNQLEQEKKMLLERKDYIKNKNESIEHGIGKETILRDKWNVVRPGEGIIVFTEPEIDPNAAKEKPSLWWRLRHFLHFGR